MRFLVFTHYGMARERSFHDIKVWSGRFNNSKKKLCSTYWGLRWRQKTLISAGHHAGVCKRISWILALFTLWAPEWFNVVVPLNDWQLLLSTHGSLSYPLTNISLQFFHIFSILQEMSENWVNCVKEIVWSLKYFARQIHVEGFGF